MKVILKEYVYKHGVAGEVVDVADGFARNYLIPRNLAIKATRHALEENEQFMAQAAVRRNELNERLVAVAKQIDGTELVFGRKAGTNGKLYGSVTTMDIADALLKKTGIDINRRRISERSLRELGAFDVAVRMGGDLAPIIRVTIVREEDLAAYLMDETAGEAEEAPVEGVEEAEEVVAALVEEAEAAETTVDEAIEEVEAAADEVPQE
jgi:large subunit ribosomal protein L9